MLKIIQLLTCVSVFVAFGAIALAEEKPPKPCVFDLPKIQASQMAARRSISAALSKQDYPTAEKLLRATLKQVPHDATAAYNLACVLARLGRADEAFESLEQSIQLGFRNPQHMKADDDLKSLRDDQRFERLLKAAGEPAAANAAGWNYKVEPNKPKDGEVYVTEENTAWNTQLATFQSFFKFPENTDQPIANGFGQAGELLRKWYEEGTAAGNHGDLYDNHDSDHSNMNFKAFPQLTRVEFSDEAKKRHLHHGLQQSFIYNAVTIGNSSTAITSGPFWRSQPRLALTQPGVAARLYLQYIRNHLYFYPEHRDHDTLEGDGKGKGHGDVYPANTPYMIISQGSSGSDRAFMNAVAATLAAFRPKVKQQLTKTGLLMPTIQMIFRSSNKTVAAPEDYLTGKAHPTAFDAKQLDVVKMIKLAHQLQAGSLPPMVQLKTVEEDQAVLGRDYFDVAPRERLFDTPCAIARVVKSTKYERRMVVSAEGSKDLHGKPLKFHWVVLRGDTKRIRINLLNDAGSIAELLVPYHQRQPIAEGSKLESSRVDMGVFVHNGDYFSAPAFISFYYLANEKRVYDDQHRIQVVDYADPEYKSEYVDPLLDHQKDWRDEYRYSDDGKLLGWIRIRGDQHQQFNSEGRLVLEQDEQGRPLKTAEVRYVAKPRPRQAPMLEQQVVEPGQSDQ